MHIEPISRDKRRRHHDHFDPAAVALLTDTQRTLLKVWLKSITKNTIKARRWETLLKLTVAKNIPVETAESLAESLVNSGAAILEEHFEHATWHPAALAWRDYEALCVACGLTTPTMQRSAFAQAWSATNATTWQRPELATACDALQDSPPDKGQTRLALIQRLNDWLRQGESGTRREFALFARGHTKQITRAEWTWLADILPLEDCGIEPHAPALWIAGDLQLQCRDRWLDIGASGDFIALPPSTLERVTRATAQATHYRLIENRTSFENVARKACAEQKEIVIWLPGYAPSWWRAAVNTLLHALPLPARISCDADPDGVQIALGAGELWNKRKLAWDAYAMSADDVATAPHKLPLTERDRQLAQSLLSREDLPVTLRGLLESCIHHGLKAEQENWL